MAGGEGVKGGVVAGGEGLKGGVRREGGEGRGSKARLCFLT